MKTDKYYYETFGGPVLGVVIFILFFFIIKPCFNEFWNHFISRSFEIGLTTFGFLLTILAIIIQGNSPSIIDIKSRKTLYKRLIQFNKRVVYLSLFLAGQSFIISGLRISIVGNYDWFDHAAISFFVFLIIWFVFDTIRFLRVFFEIILKDT